MNDDLAARRKAVAARLSAKRDLERLRHAEAVDRVGEGIAKSIRKHPSNGRPYDQESEAET